MTERTSSAEWKGTIKEGAGTMVVGNNAWSGPFSFASRFESGQGTNPEELIGAALAGCFSMFLSALLTEAGYQPIRINTSAKVELGEGPAVTRIDLSTEAEVPDLSNEEFQEKVEAAKVNCPISKALVGPTITTTARLV